MVQLTTCVLQAGLNVFCLKVRELLQYLRRGEAVRQEVQDVNTRMRMPLMQGRPPHCSGSIVMRFMRQVYSMTSAFAPAKLRHVGSGPPLRPAPRTRPRKARLCPETKPDLKAGLDRPSTFSQPVQRALQPQPGPVHDVGINLRGRHVRMPKQILDAADIGPAFQQVRGETVPQRMRRHPLEADPPGAPNPALRQAGQPEGLAEGSRRSPRDRGRRPPGGRDEVHHPGGVAEADRRHAPGLSRVCHPCRVESPFRTITGGRFPAPPRNDHRLPSAKPCRVG